MSSQRVQIITLRCKNYYTTTSAAQLPIQSIRTTKGLKRLHDLAKVPTTPLSAPFSLCSERISHGSINARRAHSRGISSSPSLQSGHSRWSKIKHDKAKADSSKNRERSEISRELSIAVKESGPDPNLNTSLSKLIAAAKKMGFPKASINAAIARGQGQSPTGAALEPLTIELLHLPTGVAGVVDILTDSKGRSLQAVRDTLKRHGASVAPVAYMFERRGMLFFSSGGGKDETTITEEALMDAALDAGAVDIQSFQGSEDTSTAATEGAVSGGFVYTEPSELAAVAEKLVKALSVKPKRKEMVWAPREDTMVKAAEGEAWKQLDDLVEKLEDDPTTVGVFLNTK